MISKNTIELTGQELTQAIFEYCAKRGLIENSERLYDSNACVRNDEPRCIFTYWPSTAAKELS